MTAVPSFTRRDAIVSTLAIAGLLTPALLPTVLPHSREASDLLATSGYAGDRHDWDWLVGKWKVRHRRLTERLMQDTRWEEFNGTCEMWTMMDGTGNVDDNYLELPSGTYRAMGVRALDDKTGLWSIWWLDARTSTIDPPVRGGFKDGVGRFIGDDLLRGKPIVARFEWSKMTKDSAHWQQAFSPDGGKTWEVNWRMDFVRG